MDWAVGRRWLGRYGWGVIIMAMLLLGIWSLADEHAARWVSTALLVLGLSALAAKEIWRAVKSSRQ